jgi:biopolymer transport protein ExbD
MAFYASRRKLRPKEHEETGELNIIPYLDIMMNLIMFMLLSITGFAMLGIINVTAPSYGGASATVQNPNDKPPLTLTVAISGKGFFIAATGAVLPGVGNDPNAPTIPKKGADYDFDALTAKMKEIKASFPTETKLIISADPTVEYSVLVHTMDATRGQAGAPLFPDVSLAQM